MSEPDEIAAMHYQKAVEEIRAKDAEIAALRKRAEKAEREARSIGRDLGIANARLMAYEDDLKGVRADARTMADAIYEFAPDGCKPIDPEAWAAVERWRARAALAESRGGEEEKS